MTPFTHSRASISTVRVDDEVLIGEVPYLVRKTVRGGMGLVFLLEQDHKRAAKKLSVHGLRAALKTILPEFINETSRNLFHRELAVWAAFRHPHVVGLNEILDGGNDGWIAAMNCCQGSLRDHINRTKRIPSGEAANITCDILDGLSYAFERDRVLHLDLKPENVLYDWDIGLALRHKKARDSEKWRFMLSDWGIASIKQEQLNRVIGLPHAAQACLETFNNMGTILYMAPERFLRGYQSSLASDIFSLGMIYFEMLIGKLPFSQNCHPVEELLSASYFEMAQICLREEKVSRPVENLILQCISPYPDSRPKSYSELREALSLACNRITGWLSKAFRGKV
jgi:serine/threonine-protein kinase